MECSLNTTHDNPRARTNGVSSADKSAKMADILARPRSALETECMDLWLQMSPENKRRALDALRWICDGKPAGCDPRDNWPEPLRTNSKGWFR